jgi:hypothetical protein
VRAPRAFGFLADAIDLALQLPVGVGLHAGEFCRQARLGLGLDARHFFGQGTGGGLFGSRFGFLKLALPHRRGFRLHTRRVLRLGALGRFLRALQLFG